MTEHRLRTVSNPVSTKILSEPAGAVQEVNL